MIFNTAAKDLDLSSGAVSNSILKAAGSTIQDEVSEKCSGGLQEGEHVTSSGGNIGIQMIFHAALCDWSKGKGPAIEVESIS